MAVMRSRTILNMGRYKISKQSYSPLSPDPPHPHSCNNDAVQFKRVYVCTC